MGAGGACSRMMGWRAAETGASSQWMCPVTGLLVSGKCKHFKVETLSETHWGMQSCCFFPHNVIRLSERETVQGTLELMLSPTLIIRQRVFFPSGCCCKKPSLLHLTTSLNS